MGTCCCLPCCCWCSLHNTKSNAEPQDEQKPLLTETDDLDEFEQTAAADDKADLRHLLTQTLTRLSHELDALDPQLRIHEQEISALAHAEEGATTQTVTVPEHVQSVVRCLL